MRKQFIENLETVVFTTKQIISKQLPVLYIAHHQDGIWEFYGNGTVNENDIKLVSLKQIIEIDSTVLDVADLPVEFNAIRDSKTSTWKIVSKN